MKKRLMLLLFGSYIEKAIAEGVEKAQAAALTGFRAIVRARRAGQCPTSSPELAVLHLIEAVEREETLKNRYANLFWDAIRELPSDRIEYFQRCVASFDPRLPGR